MSETSSPETAAPLAGKAFWRSLDEMANTPEFRAWVEQELPAHAEELVRRGGGLDRRKFLTLMGASLGLAGMSGCLPRRGSQKILTYDKKPETVIPGLPAFYATAMPRPGGAVPILAESHNGRPTKIEGNPKAPESLGASDAWSQASILDLYDPDRSRNVLKGTNRRTQTSSSWAEFDEAATKAFAELKAKQGEGLSFLTEDIASPSFDLVKAHYAQAFPKAKWFVHEPITDANALEGWKLALGADAAPRYDFAKAKVVLAIDSDFLGLEEDNVRHVRGWADARRVTDESTEMSRLYVVEPAYSVTGGMADHRLRLPASQAQDYLLALAKKLLGGLPGVNGELKAALDKFRPTPEIDSRWIELVADDLLANKGHSILIVGRRQPAASHALAALINEALENLGADKPIAVLKAPAPGGAIAELVADLGAGKVDTLVILGGNPAYSASADLDFAKAMESAKTIIRWGVNYDETSRKSDWDLPGAHYLESWGDARGIDNTLYPIQPIIDPLFGGRSVVELLASWGGYPTSDPLAIAQEAFRKAVGEEGWEPKWREFLHNGFHPGTPEYVAKPVDQQAVAAKVQSVQPAPELSAKELELVFQRAVGVDDGRYSNNGWLQEVPDPITKLTWDNAALLSPSTAREFGVSDQDLIEITADGRTLEVPVMVAPGHSNHSISLALGYGRTVVGRVGQATGFNAYLLRTSARPDIVAGGVSIRPTGKTYALATTQEHFTFDGWVSERVDELVQLQDFRPAGSHGSNGHAAAAHGKDVVAPHDGPEHGKDEGHGSEAGGHHHNPEAVGWKQYRRDFQKDITAVNPDILSGEHAWGMAIDMNVCVGCTACVVACQAENNIPIVGKSEVMRGREMHWIRNDRYFTGEDPDDPGMVMQPMTCQHCENAPCEAVCPVNATSHSDEGLNLMAYNRCVGTRYCANNCPYKVRRFNYFNFNERKLGYGNLRWGSTIYGPLTPRAMEETVKMQKNPDVTVRIRGVIEKCTYCVQRIERAKIGARVAAGQSGGDIRVKDGDVTPACAQACSAQAIVFGDLKDENSRVSKLKASQRDFLVIGEVNTKPRTSYLRRLRNPNPRWGEAGAASERSEG